MRRNILLLAAALVLPGAAPATPAERAEVALRLLLAASSLPVPASSSCHGIIPGIPRPTLGDVLAQPLAGLDGGINRIGGGCDRGACRIQITHRGAEEDVFSYEFQFRTTHGRLVPTSLNCFSTP